MAEGHRKPSAATVLPEIPDKLYFRIGEVARLLDLPTYVLRFWETEFPQLKPNKGGTGQRLYRRRDVEMALRIRVLLYDEGYTIPGARQFLKSESSSSREAAVESRPVTATVARETADGASDLRRLRSELHELSALLARPSPGTRGMGGPERASANPAHRGLHMAHPRRRTPDEPRTADLFPSDDSGN